MDKTKILLEKIDEIFNWKDKSNKYIDEVRKLKAFRCISSSILSWNFYVWWKISKSSLFSNFFWSIISSFTQSYYTHVNFCFPDYEGRKLKWYYVFWAENKKGVVFDYYDLQKPANFIYVVKKFDKERFLKNFDIKKYWLNISYLFWEKDAKSYINRYITFQKFFDKKQYHLNGIWLDDLIEFELFYEKYKNIEVEIEQTKENLSPLYKEIENITYKFKEKVWYNLQDVQVKYMKHKDFLDKLFFNWGMLKFMIHSFHIKYDMVWALSIILVDWKKWVDYAKNWPKKLFCSELISASMLFAGFYPFDLVTKAPDSVSPWDMMDPSYWLYEQDYTVINYKTWQKLQVRDLKSLKSFKKMVKDFK